MNNVVLFTAINSLETHKNKYLTHLKIISTQHTVKFKDLALITVIFAIDHFNQQEDEHTAFH